MLLAERISRPEPMLVERFSRTHNGLQRRPLCPNMAPFHADGRVKRSTHHVVSREILSATQCCLLSSCKLASERITRPTISVVDDFTWPHNLQTLARLPASQDLWSSNLVSQPCCWSTELPEQLSFTNIVPMQLFLWSRRSIDQHFYWLIICPSKPNNCSGQSVQAIVAHWPTEFLS